MPFVPDEPQKSTSSRLVFDDEIPTHGFVPDQPNPKREESGGFIQDVGRQLGFVSEKPAPNVFDQFDGQHGFVPDQPAGRLVFDDEVKSKPKDRTLLQAAGDTAIDAAKGVVGLGESIVGLTDLPTGNLSGKGWAAMGFDPDRTRQILSELYSDSRQQANRTVAETKGFFPSAGAMLQNPSTIAGGIVESAPLMLGGIAEVRAVALKMLAARGLVAGTTEAAAFLESPAVIARLTAIGSAAEGATTTGQIQENSRQAGRDWIDSAPSAVAAGVITGLIGVGSSKIPGLHDSEVGAALAGLSGASKRQGLITAGKEIGKGFIKEGALEEFPQSAQEQVWTNIALGKDPLDGVAEAGAQGLIVGGFQGGGMNAYSSGRNALARTVPSSVVPGADKAPTNVRATSEATPTQDPGSLPSTEPTPVQAPAARPEMRLAELDLLAQTRDLTPQEIAEGDTLVQAMDEKAQGHDAANPAPAFEDVPDFPVNTDQTVKPSPVQLDAPVLPDPVTGEPVAPTDARYPYVAQAQGEAGPAVADPQALAAGDVVSWSVNGKQISGLIVTPPDAKGNTTVRATGAEAGAGVRTGGTFNVPITKLSITQTNSTPGATVASAPTGVTVKAAPNLTWFGFLKEKGVAPGSIRKATNQYFTLREEFDARKTGTPAAPAASTPRFVPDAPDSQVAESVAQPVGQFVPDVSASIPAAAPPVADVGAQNRDRSRAASVMQMTNIANSPDYGRLGTSRTPDSGAPMVFAVGDDVSKIPDANFGHKDVAVMADGQRVPFYYAVADAETLDPSHFADGRINPAFDANVMGTIKALNNGRTAGLRAAHENGTAGAYMADMATDAANTGISAEAIQRTPNPVLVRVYHEASNTPNMAAKSQGQGLGMSPGELARQDAPLMDATVLTVYRPGDVGSAANRDFVRSFVGKLVQSGNDVAGMMTAQGTLSPAGRIRIQAALVQAAYGDSELVAEMFDSQDTDIKAIGEALKAVAGQWADMRDSARMGAIDAHVDITGNLVQAVNLIRKSRTERTSLIDLVRQPDLMTGQTPDVLTTALLRVFYSGQYLTRALGRDQVINKLSAYAQAAMNSSHGADMFGQTVTVDQILATIINEGESHANTSTTESRTGTDSGGDIGRALDDRGAVDTGQRNSEGGPGSGENSAGQREAGPRQVSPGSDQAGQDPQAGALSPVEPAGAKPAAKIEDAGQKIGGARKDRWKEHGLSLADLDGMSESEGAELATKANVWKPDYAGMVQDGTRPQSAAFIKVVYDSLAAKPKDNTPEGRRRYVTMMQHVRQAYSELAQLDYLGTKTERKAMSDAAEALKIRLGLRSQDPETVKAGRALLFSVYKGRSDPFVVGLAEDQRARKLVADGFPDAGEPWKKRLTVRAYGGPGLTTRGTELVVEAAAEVGTPITAEQAKAGIYQVITKAGKVLAYLPTQADAQAAAKNIYDTKLKTGASDKVEPNRPHLDKLTRENLPQRIDRDAVADDFVKDFGFRGIEFGNWAAQDERQRIINMAYDGLMDLAEIMGVPAKSLSLNGSLGLAFGARGGGKFAAHYEPGKLVINVTKLQGGGSMAHEWAHALDHYFGELNQKDAYTTNTRGASGWYSEDQYKGVPRSRMEKVGGQWVTVNKMRLDNMRPEMAKAFDDVMSALFSGQETKAEMVRSLELQLERTQALAAKETDPQTKAMYQRSVTSQTQNLEESRNEPDDKLYPKGRSKFAGQAQALNGKSVKGYWSRPTEMFARAFESWVFDKVVSMGAKSDYLVHGVEEDRFAGGGYKGNPYPAGQERANINAAFDALVNTIQTKETDKGVAMFSRTGESDLLTSYDKTDALKKQEAEAAALKQEQKPAPKPVQKKVTADQVDMFNPQESLFARKASVKNSLPVAQVQSIIEAIRSQWSNAPAVVVAASMDDSAIPAAVREYDQKQRSLGATGSPEGFLHGGKVYVLADQLATATDVIRVLFHESLGHSGLRGVFGDSLHPILQQIIQTRKTEVAAKAKQYGLDLTKPEDALTAAEEVLAGMAQDKPELGFVKRAVAAIRTWLRANVPGFKDLELTDAEIINSYILPARAFVQHGRTVSGGAAQTPAFSRNTLGDTPTEPIAPAQINVWTAVKNRVMRLTSPENIDKLIYEFQDKHVDLKRLQAHIKELGGTITDLNDAYLGEELFHKRLAKRTEDFLGHELKPLLVQMHADGVSLEELETFLHARHAPEANAALAKRNPNRAELDLVKDKAKADVKELELKLQHARNNGSATVAIATALDEAKAEARKWQGAQAYQGSEGKRMALSGMSDADAAAHIAGIDAGKRKQLEALAAKVDAINSKTLDLLEQYGLMDRASISAWRSAYQHYVPLHRDEARAESASHPIGSGFSVKGNAAKQRTGSNEKVTHILGHIAMQREAALTRGEKNNVAKKLYLMAAQNPDDSVWSVDTPPMIKSVDQSTGTVRLGVDPLYKTRPNVLMVRIAGKDVAVVFNEDNPQAVRLVGALKNLDVGDLHVVLGLAAKGTRWFASVNTQFNPIFGLINFTRDFGESMVNLSTTPIAGKQKELAKGVPAAMRAIYRQERGKGAAGAENARWVQLWDEMQNVGGATGFRDLYSDAEARVKALTKELEALDRGEVSKAAHAVVDWLSDYNETMENAVRLSAYKVALDSGMTKERAASLSKNLTVNFNRKGRQTREIGALYAFFNAAIQGTARMAETLKGPKGKKIMLGGVALGAINGLVGMVLMGGGGNGDDDEWSKIPDFIKENSLIIPISRKDYLSIPMPLGFKVLPNIGRLAVEFALGGPDKTLGKELSKMLGVLADAFNPLGGTQNLGQMLAPTVIDPIVALMQNRDWTGRPIYRENNSPLNPQPGTKMVKNSASTAGKGLATAINSITGGSEYRPGAWSPSPDQLDFIFGQLTGGLGRELLKANQVITAPFTGDEVPAYKIPLIGRLYGNTNGPAAESEQFYANVKRLNEIENEIKGRARHGGDVDAYRKTEPLAELVGAGNGYELLVSRLRKNRGIVVERAADGYQGQVKEIDKQIGEAMANLNRQVSKAQRQPAAR